MTARTLRWTTNSARQLVGRVTPNRRPVSVREYFALLDRWENPRLELVDGHLEVLPVAEETHEFIMLFLLEAMLSFTQLRARGWVLPSGIKIRVRKTGKPRFRQPDLTYLKQEHGHLRRRKYWLGADLVMEIVSGGRKDWHRDFVEKLVVRHTLIFG